MRELGTPTVFVSDASSSAADDALALESAEVVEGALHGDVELGRDAVRDEHRVLEHEVHDFDRSGALPLQLRSVGFA